MERQLREKITFDPNIPVEVTLEFDSGKQVEGRSGPQWQYFLADQKIMYIDPDLAEKIAATGARANDTLEICKRTKRNGSKTYTEWEVVHICDEPANSPMPQPAAKARIAAAPPAAKPAAALPMPAAPHHGITPARSAAIMTAAFMAALEVAQETEQYAAARGVRLPFDADAIQRIATTIYIQETKR